MMNKLFPQVIKINEDELANRSNWFAENVLRQIIDPKINVDFIENPQKYYDYYALIYIGEKPNREKTIELIENYKEN